MNGASASLARRRAISVLPTPVGPIIRMFFGMISACISSGQRETAIAVAQGNRHGTLRIALPDDVAVQLANDLLGSQIFCITPAYESALCRARMRGAPRSRGRAMQQPISGRSVALRRPPSHFVGGDLRRAYTPDPVIGIDAHRGGDLHRRAGDLPGAQSRCAEAARGPPPGRNCRRSRSPRTPSSGSITSPSPVSTSSSSALATSSIASRRRRNLSVRHSLVSSTAARRGCPDSAPTCSRTYRRA